MFLATDELIFEMMCGWRLEERRVVVPSAEDRSPAKIHLTSPFSLSTSNSS